jgi:hypothetical protein
MYGLISMSSPQICVFELRRGHRSEAVHRFVGRHRFEEKTRI